MVADPTVLFLDEPTSALARGRAALRSRARDAAAGCAGGLDSTSSMEVCAALRRIAHMGLNVILVLHQPRCARARWFLRLGGPCCREVVQLIGFDLTRNSLF